MKPGAAAGLRCLFAGIRLLVRPRIRRFVLIPLLINTALFAAATVLGVDWLDGLLDRTLPDWLAFLEFIIWPLVALTALVISFFAFTLVANFLGAPFNGFLAEAVADRLGGAPVGGAFRWRRLPLETAGALLGEVRKLAYFALLGLPLLLLFVIPGLQIIAPAAWFLFGAWALCVEYADYPLGNAGLAFPRQRATLRSHRALALGFGAGVALMTSVPVLNFFAMPAAVAGATVMWHRYLREAPPAGQ